MEFISTLRSSFAQLLNFLLQIGLELSHFHPGQDPSSFARIEKG